MLLIPAIDLKDGRCVRLRQGRMEDETVFSDDPVEMAGRWVGQGARRLHLACQIADSWGHGMPGETWSPAFGASIDRDTLADISQRAHDQFVKVTRSHTMLERAG